MQREDFLNSFGGWVLDPKPCIRGALPEKLASVFYDLFSKLDGGGYTPLVYCGYQIANGTNYMIICKVTYTTAEPKTALAKVILHETIPASGLFGEFSILSIETIAEEAKFGGYKLEPFAYLPGELSKDPIKAAFDQALDGFDGSKIFPLAYCGTQMLAPENTNIMFICSSTVVGKTLPQNIDEVVLNKKGEVFKLASITKIV